MTILIRAVVLSDFPAVALEAGLDPYAELRRAGIDPGIFTQPDLLVASDSVATLLEGAAKRSGLPDFALRLAMRRQIAHLGVSGLVLCQQPTVREALATANRYRHLLNEALSAHVSEQDDLAIIRVQLDVSNWSGAAQASELSVAAFVHLFRLLLGDHWHPESVHFAHPAPTGASLHRRFFGCPVSFNADFDGFACPSEGLDRHNTQADAALAAHARALLDALPGNLEQSVLGLVRRLVLILLPMGKATIASVARATGKNVRTLQREIDASGTSFKALLSDIRHDLCQSYLRGSDHSIARISEQLGYSSPPAFIRWFRTRFGIPPQEWREMQSAEDNRQQSAAS